MLNICQFGAGRIGAVHAADVAQHKDATLRYVVDVNATAAQNLADRHGASVADTEKALADPEVNAVIIASSTDTHADLIEASAKAGKAIFCEKPIDLDINRVNACLETVKRCNVPLALGFNRRFDPTFRAIHEGLRAGRIGKLEMIAITSRDPGPPPVSYIKVSGGLFRDMMIHDFDMARWLLGEEPVEVLATASCLVDPEIGKVGDVDTATVILKTAGGALCQISNSRRAVYGYDQRIEAFGSAGMLRAENETATRVEFSGAEAVCLDKPVYFFLERYSRAYIAELDDFVQAVTQGRAPVAGGEDGRQALVLADAALESYQTGKAVKL